MTNELYAFLISLLAGLSTLIGSLLIFLKIDNNKINNYLAFFLSFSTAIMIGISVFDLLPEGLPIIIWRYNYLSIFILFLCFVISYIFIKYLNKFVSNNNSTLYKVGVLSMVTLIIHNLPEGIITYLSSLTNIKLGIKMAVAIAMHNIPEGILISMPIYYGSGKKARAVLYSLLSGLSEPLGALLTYIFLKKYISSLLMGFILIIVASLMIVLAIENIFPETNKYNNKRNIILGFLVGIVVIFISLIL